MVQWLKLFIVEQEDQGSIPAFSNFFSPWVKGGRKNLKPSILKLFSAFR